MVKDLSRVASSSKKPEVPKNHLMKWEKKKWEKEEQPETEVVQSKAECNNNLVTPYRYQTITFENLGYSGKELFTIFCFAFTLGLSALPCHCKCKKGCDTITT